MAGHGIVDKGREDVPRRVLVIGMTDNPGGIETLLLNLLSVVDQSRVRFDFIVNTSEVAYEKQLLDYGARIFKITARRKSRTAFYRDLRRIFDEHAGEYDAVWENVNSLGNIDYLVYAKRYGIPRRIIHAHNSVNSEGFIRGVLHFVNRMRIRRIATHFWSASDEASRWFFGEDYASLAHYKVISNAIDLKRFSFDPTKRTAERKKLGLMDGDLLIGNVGRLHPQKNQKEILKTVAELRNRGARVHALIVGKGELEPELRMAASRLGIEGCVHFPGAVEDTSSLYCAMDLFFFPSLYEGLGIVLLEAQANGLPCLISDRIPRDAVWNDNVTALPLESTPSLWADEALAMMSAGRTGDIKLVGSRFDLSSWGDAMADLFLS